MSTLKRKVVFKDLNEATAAYNLLVDKVASLEKLEDRIEQLEKYIRVLYHTQKTLSRNTTASLSDASTGLSNANRKITQFSKK